MQSQGKRESEPALGAGGFFTAGMRAPAKLPHRRKRGVGTSIRDLHTLTLPCSYLRVPFHSMSFKRTFISDSLGKMAAITYSTHPWLSLVSIHSLIHTSQVIPLIQGLLYATVKFQSGLV